MSITPTPTPTPQTIEYYKSLSPAELIKEYEKWQDIYKLADLNQYTLKILMNSSYGSLSLNSNPFSAYGVIGPSITSTGRFYNRWVAYRINIFLNQELGYPYDDEGIMNLPFTIQADTDSSYNLLEQICDKYIPQADPYERLVFAQQYFDEKIMPIVKDAIDEVSYTLNVRHPEVMKMDQETTTSKFISVAPKRYYLRNHYKEIEGQIVVQPLDKFKLKITGLSVVGKSTPSWSKKRLKPLMDLILDKSEQDMANYVNNMKKEIYGADLISICQFKKVSTVNFDSFEDNKFLRYSENGNLTTVGGHGKGALWYNKFLFDNKLDKRYSYIQGGDIVKVLPLFKENPLIQSDTIAFTDIKFIQEQGFDKYIDYDTLFDKIFVSNVNIILKPLNWEIYNTEENLENMWGF